VAGYAKMVYPQTVTHPSTNRVRHTVTMLIETNALPLSQATNYLLLSMPGQLRTIDNDVDSGFVASHGEFRQYILTADSV